MIPNSVTIRVRCMSFVFIRGFDETCLYLIARDFTLLATKSKRVCQKPAREQGLLTHLPSLTVGLLTRSAPPIVRTLPECRVPAAF